MSKKEISLVKKSQDKSNLIKKSCIDGGIASRSSLLIIVRFDSQHVLLLKHVPLIVLQFLNAFLDVIQRSVDQLLGWAVAENRTVPALAQFLNGTDVHDPVVQVLVQPRHVAIHEHPVHVH